MKALTLFLLVLLMLIPISIHAQKKEKKKFEWAMPEKLTGNRDFDHFLLTCDSLYSRIQSYNDSIVYYKVVQAETGNFDETGQPLYQYAIVDDEGNVRNTGRVILQYTNIILTGTNIILDCTNLSLLTITATASLPSLGLNAFGYAKYVKSGPAIVKIGVAEIKKIVASSKAQGATIRALKSSSTNTGENKDVVMISSQIPDGIEIIQETKEEMDERVKNAVIEEVGSADDIDESVFG